MSDIRLDETHYDVIVCGTSLTESMIASAAAQAGKKVLCVDGANTYGGAQASLPLIQLQACIDKIQRGPQPVPQGYEAKWKAVDLAEDIREGLEFMPYHSHYGETVPSNSFFDASYWMRPDAKVATTTSTPATTTTTTTTTASTTTPATPESTKQPDDDTPVVASWQELKKQARKYNLDLCAQPIFARGYFIDLLIRSGVGTRYMEFKAVDTTYVMESAKTGVDKVPMSKSDVFTNTQIGMADKRVLMRVLTSVLGDARDTEKKQSDTDELQEWAERPFAEWLSFRRLSAKLKSLVMYCIALLPSQQDLPAGSYGVVTTTQGTAALRRFLASLGRFGPGGFIFPTWGFGEFAQAFSRSCAVHGGIFILRFPPTGLVFDKRARTPKFAGILSAAGQYLTADRFVCSPDFVPHLVEHKHTTVHCVAIIDGSVRTVDGKSTTGSCLLTLPPGVAKNKHPIRGLQLDSSMQVCPKGKGVLALNCLLDLDDTRSAKDVLWPALELLADLGDAEATERPKVFWVAFFSRTVRLPASVAHPEESNVYICPDPLLQVGADDVVQQAEKHFLHMFPESAFLPAPAGPGHDQDTMDHIDADLLDDIDESLAQGVEAEVPTDNLQDLMDDLDDLDF